MVTWKVLIIIFVGLIAIGAILFVYERTKPIIDYQFKGCTKLELQVISCSKDGGVIYKWKEGRVNLTMVKIVFINSSNKIDSYSNDLPPEDIGSIKNTRINNNGRDIYKIGVAGIIKDEGRNRTCKLSQSVKCN